LPTMLCMGAKPHLLHILAEIVGRRIEIIRHIHDKSFCAPEFRLVAFRLRNDD
jgi:hypothetical protein